jgi:hypothetical protein
MTDTKEKVSPLINEVLPAETAGRDTIARFQAQFRAAAYACLEILNGKSIDRVYCDYQDDFVRRESKNGQQIYHFYQVKTKAKLNYQWGKPEIFGLPKRNKPQPEQIAASFAGKLIMHTIRFKNSCGNVVFLTNVQLDNELDEVSAALISGDLNHHVLKTFMQHFNEAFVEGDPLDSEAIREKVARLSLVAGIPYLHPHSEDFEALARDAIFKYSEIDLQHVESAEIINNLVALVQKKSFSKVIADLTEEEFDDVVGIGIAELLDILSISKGAYHHLLAGGDVAALKSASIIQRKLSKAGANVELIEYCSKWKVAWDVWIRDKRHSIPEYDLNGLLDELNAIQNRWSGGHVKFADLRKEIDGLWIAIKDKEIAATLSRELLVGGVLSALVRSEAQ